MENSQKPITDNCEGMPVQPKNEEPDIEVQNLTAIADVTKSLRNIAIRGRAVYKSSVNVGKTGPVFSFHVRDTTGTIEFLAFDGDAGNMHELIELGQVYVIRNVRAFPVVRVYAPAETGHEFHLRRDWNRTTVTHVPDDGSCPALADFTEIGDIAPAVSLPEPGVEVEEAYPLVNVKGIVTDVSPVKSTTCSKTGQQLTYRTVRLAGKSGDAPLTLWNKRAHEFTAQTGDTIIAMNAKVTDGFNGSSLTGSQSFVMQALKADSESVPGRRFECGSK